MKPESENYRLCSQEIWNNQSIFQIHGTHEIRDVYVALRASSKNVLKRKGVMFYMTKNTKVATTP